MQEQTTDKIVDGVTYERDYSIRNCTNCAAFAEQNSVCATLVEDDCSTSYTFKFKDIAKHPLPSEQKGVKTDTGKPRYGLIPPFALEQVAICLTEGLKTHPDKDNWKLVENGKERFLESLERHFQQYKMGETFDRDEPKVRNLAAVIVNALFALEFEVNPELKGKV